MTVNICVCTEEREDCPGADELATQCSRNCMKKDDNKDCLECMENCSGTVTTKLILCTAS